jgi:hypothetical protein
MQRIEWQFEHHFGRIGHSALRQQFGHGGGFRQNLPPPVTGPESFRRATIAADPTYPFGGTRPFGPARFPECREYASAVLLPERFRGRLAPSAARVSIPLHSPALTPGRDPTTIFQCGNALAKSINFAAGENHIHRAKRTRKPIFSGCPLPATKLNFLLSLTIKASTTRDFIVRTIFAATLIIACFATTAANATITVIPAVGGVFPGGTYTEVLPEGAPGSTTGVYGVETRGGDGSSAATWEIGVGPGTSQSGYFNQANMGWSAPNAFTLTWNSSGITFAVAGGPTVSWGPTAKLKGNAFKIYAKQSTAVLTDIDGVTVNTAIPLNGETLFYSSNNWGGDGFIANGTVSIVNGGGSAREVMFKHGTFAPVPESATWAMLIAGFGLTGATMRRARLGGAARVPVTC